MNLHIQKLAEQAGITFTDYGSGEFLAEDDISLPRLEKFAELIVRDCALTAGIMEYEGRAGIGAQLLDNFGVEE